MNGDIAPPVKPKPAVPTTDGMVAAEAPATKSPSAIPDTSPMYIAGAGFFVFVVAGTLTAVINRTPARFLCVVLALIGLAVSLFGLSRLIKNDAKARKK